ncbi:MAG: cyclic lactone autoinducer peptide [Ruminococcus sp.]
MKMVKKVVGALAIKSAKVAAGTASANIFAQPKEPENLKKYFKK